MYLTHFTHVCTTHTCYTHAPHTTHINVTHSLCTTHLHVTSMDTCIAHTHTHKIESQERKHRAGLIHYGLGGWEQRLFALCLLCSLLSNPVTSVLRMVVCYTFLCLFIFLRIFIVIKPCKYICPSDKIQVINFVIDNRAVSQCS